MPSSSFLPFLGWSIRYGRGRSWLTVGNPLGSSEGEHEGRPDGMVLALGATLKVGDAEGWSDDSSEGLSDG